jgi:hypothetical protein
MIFRSYGAVVIFSFVLEIFRTSGANTKKPQRGEIFIEKLQYKKSSVGA